MAENPAQTGFGEEESFVAAVVAPELGLSPSSLCSAMWALFPFLEGGKVAPSIWLSRVGHVLPLFQPS